jgi:hypothetical protein
MLVHPEIPESTIGLYHNEGGRVFVEGIIPGDIFAHYLCLHAQTDLFNADV